MDSAPDMNRTGSDGNTSADHASSAAKVIFFAFFAAFYTSIYVFILGCSFFEKTSINKALLPNVSQPPIISYFVLMQATRTSFHIANYKKKTLLLLREIQFHGIFSSIFS